jgi:transcriptional regulator with XRE-family HTH domain
MKKLRQKSQLSLHEFSHICGVSIQSIQQWEAGICGPKERIQPIVAKSLGVSIGVLRDAINESKRKYRDERKEQS